MKQTHYEPVCTGDPLNAYEAGFRAGRKEERADVLDYLRNGGPEDGTGILDAVAEAIENANHEGTRDDRRPPNDCR